MKRIAFASIVLVALTIACAPTPTVVLPTAPVTATVAPTITPTLTPAPTSSPTQTPAVTHTPTLTWALTATAAPTATEIPRLTATKTEIPGKVVWVSPATTKIDGRTDSWETDGWSGFHLNGGVITEVEDEQFGRMLEFKVTQDQKNVKIQSDKIGPPISAPFEIEFLLKLGNDFEITDANGGGVNLLSPFSKAPPYHPVFSLPAAINMGASLRPFLIINIPDTAGTWKETQKTITLQKNKGYEFKYRLDKDGTISFFIDGVLRNQALSYNAEIARVEGRLYEPEQLTDMHAGSLYGNSIKTGSTIRRGQITIRKLE